MRILVVDDHEFVRRGICSLLVSQPHLALCGEAVDGRDAVEKAKQLHPDVVIMDISMPRMNGLEATREIKRFLPESEVVIVSQHDAPEMVRQAFNAGARAYVVKSTISTDLLAAIAKVKQREPFVQGVVLPNSNQNIDAQEILQRSAAFEKALRESEERFRVILSDAIMPGMNGIEIGIKIREIVTSCRIILFSGQAATVDLLERDHQQGHHVDILAKPIKPEQLISAIRASARYLS